jgi:multicomponent Na+:H+ antiporter subunit D
MVELGLYAVARLHWLVFFPSLDSTTETAIREVFLLIGALTAVIGAIYCFGQRHLKRLLAFSTISHVGLMVIGFALLTPGGLAGTAVYLVGHGMIKGALFLGAGILLHRCGSVDEYDLRGSGGNLKPLAGILALGAFALAGMPPFATFYGQSQIHEAAAQLGLHWLSPVTIIAEALTAGAVLRFTGRVFVGWGKRREATSRGSPHIPMETETAGEHDTTPIFMWLPAAALLVLAALVPLSKSFSIATADAADHFEQPQLIAHVTLDAAIDTHPIPMLPQAHFRAENIITLAAALFVAAITLFPQYLGKRINWLLSRGLIAFMKPLRSLQSGNVGDYVAWFAFGIAVYGGLLFALCR